MSMVYINLNIIISCINESDISKNLFMNIFLYMNMIYYIYYIMYLHKTTSEDDSVSSEQENFSY